MAPADPPDPLLWPEGPAAGGDVADAFAGRLIPAELAPAEKAPKPHYHGHRQRLRDRMAMAGINAFQDYELLEYLLGLVKARGDTKAQAKDLLAAFGKDLGKVLAASPEALAKVKGIGPESALAIKFVHALMVRGQKQFGLYRNQRPPLLSGWQSLIDYLNAAMADRTTEQFRVIFLNSRNYLISDEDMGDGTINAAPVYPREVVRRALELGAAAVILVHNHPSGDAQPSRDDIQMTRAIIDAGKTMGIAVHDHVIIARGGHVSMRSAGLI